jgi:hypothetical protein
MTNAQYHFRSQWRLQRAVHKAWYMAVVEQAWRGKFPVEFTKVVHFRIYETRD